ncbi:hypothetical protein EDC19_1260 [Natranaerovirga hydrolytica]|uniref:ABC transporter substrate-binding protein n=1 Tax=Natranaerovirga hydrolytica TaxID=680378 RepID=A0A4R1N1I8_9FIRM|nr:DUF6062 family protein [Natranaerovirga hydrolytica]TCK98820.1 hypothetical protein EDC19_1260 [Natranaerovirga hydrolytica]
MKEKIYTIPVLDAFNENDECPFCWLYSKIETDTIEFITGPSYMENDIRDATNESGFCDVHMQKIYNTKNRLGLALMLYTHQMKYQKDIKAILKNNPKVDAKGFFNKKNAPISELKAYIDKVNIDCYVCNKVDKLMDRYIDTFFYLWKKDSSFVDQVKTSKGFCNNHFGVLYEASRSKLKGEELNQFIDILCDIYFENIARVQEDLDWFVKKFDYRYKEEPWKEGKDALPRSIVKINSYTLNEK